MTNTNSCSIFLKTWTFKLSPPHALWSLSSVVCARAYTFKRTRAHTHRHVLEEVYHWIERPAQRPCHCSFISLLIDMPGKLLKCIHTHVHMHAEWLYLSPVFSSITFTSFCSACPSLLFFFCRQLKGLQQDFVKCLCERFSACCLAPLCPPSNLFQRPPPVL